MKKQITSIILALFSISAFSQQFYHQNAKNPDMLKVEAVSQRTEIILPEVNGFKLITADLHAHTFFSDGSIAPQQVVLEAWADGLDAIAITDHIEYRPNEKRMKAFLADEIVVKDEKGLTPDYNFVISDAKDRADGLGITIIPGIEITRDPVKLGHFNALFTTDNNLIPDKDPLQAIRNAKQQGAVVQNNHPGWRREDNGFTPVMQAALKEGLVDGVEVFNSTEFYPDVIEEGIRQGLYLSSGTDIHKSSKNPFAPFGVLRNMTFLFAKDASLPSLREALDNHRTLAYAYGEIAGSEELLQDFFKASFDSTVIQEKDGKKRVRLTNKTSLYYVISVAGGSPVIIRAFSSEIFTVRKYPASVSVLNMWTGPDKHPAVTIGQ